MYTDGKKAAHVAIICYGWEDEAFYKTWTSYPLSKEELHDLEGPTLAMLQPQSEYAPVLLEHFAMLLRDEVYARRIQQHYEMYRRVIDEQGAPAVTMLRSTPKGGPNQPCPCGSGKKFKKCCDGVATRV